MDRHKKSHLVITATFVVIGLVATVGIIAVALRGVRSDGSAHGIGGDSVSGGPPSWMIVGMDGPPAERIATAEKIGAQKNLAGLAVLERGAASDPDPAVKIACLNALGELRNPGPTPAIRVLGGHGDPGVRAAAAEALGKIESDLALPALLRLAKDGDAHVRSAGASALATKDDESAAKALMVLSGDGQAGVRLSAVGAAARRTDVISRQALANRAAQDRDNGVRTVAAAALREIGAEATPYLVRALPSSESPEGRQLGVDLAVELGGTNSIEGLLSAIEKAQAKSSIAGSDLSERAAKALARLGPEGVPALITAASASGRTIFGREAAEAAVKRINP